MSPITNNALAAGVSPGISPVAVALIAASASAGVATAIPTFALVVHPVPTILIDDADASVINTSSEFGAPRIAMAIVPVGSLSSLAAHLMYDPVGNTFLIPLITNVNGLVLCCQPEASVKPSADFNKALAVS